MKYSYLSRRVEELSKKNLDEIPLAYVWDRIAAFVVDFIIISITANVLLSPLRKKMQSAILDEHDGLVNLMVLGIVCGYAVFFVLYHSIATYAFGKTIGKKIFKIDVVSLIHGQKLTFVNCLIRSVTLFISFIALCIPLLEVFSNRLRRPLHDRFSDTYVRSSKRQDTAPTMVERLWVRFIYAMVAANIFAMAFAQLLFFRDDIRSLSEFVTQPEYLCAKVSEAKSTWPNTTSSRMDIALTLYGADRVDEGCLEREAQRAISYGEELDKAYLAKAFIYENNSEISDKYLTKVCSVGPENEACVLTEMIAQWSEQNWKGADILLTKKKIENDYLKVWAIKHFDKTQNYSALINLLDEMWLNKSLNDFLGKYRALTLWKLDKPEESRGVFQSTYAYMPDNSKISFASELCNLEIESGCAVSSKSACGILVEQLENGPRQQMPEETLLTYIKTNQCGMTDVKQIVDSFRFYIDDPKIQMYLAGIKAKSEGKNIAADQIFRNILRTTSKSSFLNYEVRSMLVDLADENNLKEHAKWWQESENTGLYHQALGTKIIIALSSRSLWNDAGPMARKLFESHHLTKHQAKTLAVVFYNTREFELARKVVALFEEKTKSSRSIASPDRFKQIVEKIKRSGR